MTFDVVAFPQVACVVGSPGADLSTLKTYSPKPEHVRRRWYVLDADRQVLGRVATEAAHILRGKHKPIYAPHVDVGDHVIIVNAAKVVLTGGKESKKVAYRHSGHPGGITATVYADLLARRPAFAVEKAVRGMLPKNRLGRAMIKKLHVEPGPEHRHQAQRPEAWTIGERPVWEGLPAPASPPPSDGEERETASSGRTGGARSKTGASKAATRTTSKRTTSAAEASPPASREPTASKRTAATRRSSGTGGKKAGGARNAPARRKTKEA
jgi:large subunit ribosomal protein L13